MALDVRRLQRATALIVSQNGESVRTGVFLDLQADLDHAIALARQSQATVPLPRRHASHRLMCISGDLWNIQSLLERLDSAHQEWASGVLPDGRWFRFASLDIDMLHVELRSLFDYVSQLLKEVSDNPTTKHGDSFERFRTWVAKNSNAQRVGVDIAAILVSCDWFSSVREVRDDLIHRGANTLTFLEKPHFWFQVYQARQIKVTLPEVMANDNVVDLPTYAGMLYGYLLDFLEQVAAIVYHRIGLTRTPLRSQQKHPGIAIGKQWIEKAIDAATASSGSSEASNP